MIIAKLIGGLGNQMFQYAIGRHLAHINCTELKLDISGFNDYKLHAYGLSHFNIVENFATEKEVTKFQKYKRKPGRKWFLYNRLVANETKYVQEKQFHFDPRILETRKEAYLDGYWQTEKYFKDIKDIIRQDFILKLPLGDKSKKIAENIRSCEAVAIHIRRGDYVTNQQTNEYHGTCGIDYYRKAIEILAEKVSDPHIFIFSDDHEWVKNNVTLKYPATYVSHNKADKNYEDLKLISLCKHQIIANSSFSWWGAWLNPNKEKIVIAPTKWFQAPKMDTRDIIPDSWIKL